MNEAAGRVQAQVELNRDRTVEFLRDLVRATRDGESAVQVRVAAAAKKLGCAVETVRYRPRDVPMLNEFAAETAMVDGERESVVARLKGSRGGRSLIFFAHPDGEPVERIERWRHDPFAATVENGRLYGWGVADDLAGVAAFVQALDAVVAAGLKPAGDVILCSTPSKRHARGVTALLHQGYVADGAIYLHPAESGVGMREIKAFASGQLEFRVIVPGQPPDTSEPGHAAFAHLAVNPLDKVWVVYRALRELDARRGARIRHAALDAAVGRSTNLLVSGLRCGEGGRYGRVAGECVLTGALSFPPPERLEDVQAELLAAVDAACAADPWLKDHRARVEWHAGVTGAEVAVEHPLYRAVSDAILAVTGEQPHVNPMHTSSDIRVPNVQKGIPTVGLGPLCGDLSQNGRHDEWVDVDDYVRTVKVAASAIVDWCGVT